MSSGQSGDIAISPLEIPDFPRDEDGESDVEVHVAAVAYARAGWYVVPITRGSSQLTGQNSRGKNPGSVLGKDWHRRSSRDLDVVRAWFDVDAPLNIGLHVGRSGAVVVDVDKPEAIPDVLRSALGASPFQNTRSTQVQRGHAVFLQPPGRVIGNSMGRLTGGWGDIRGTNGIIVVEPSVHPNALVGGRYLWLATGVVPVLPPQIADLLPDAAAGEAPASPLEVEGAKDTFDCPVDADAIGAIAGYCTRFRTLVSQGESRHTSAVGTAMWAAKEARAGLVPLRRAFAQLRQDFIAAVTTDAGGREQRTMHEAASEWAGIESWVVSQVLALPEEDIERTRALFTRNRREPSSPQEPHASLPPRPTPSLDDASDFGPFGKASLTGLPVTSDVVAGGVTGGSDVPRFPPGSGLALPDETFWDNRASLKHIKAAALARGVSVWGVLGCVLVRVITSTRPGLRSPGVELDEPGGSLNMQIVLMGPSGHGKGRADATAEQLFQPLRIPGVMPGEGVDNPEADDQEDIFISGSATEDLDFWHPGCDPLPVGTGEGITKSFVRRERLRDDDGKLLPGPGVLRQYRERALFVETEIESLATKGLERQGATLIAVLRKAFSGEDPGSSNSGEETRLALKKHSYRACLVVHAQDATSEWLLADTAGGTPQRIVFFDAVNAAATMESFPWPGPLPWAQPPEAKRRSDDPFTMTLPPDARRWIKSIQVAKSLIESGRPLPDELADLADSPYVKDAVLSHGGFVRSKIACAIALLDGRAHVSDDDWALSENVMGHSYAIVLRVRARTARETKERSQREGRRQALVGEAAEQYALDRAKQAVLGVLKRAKAAAGDDADAAWVLHSNVNRAMRRHRLTWQAAVVELVDAGVVLEEERATAGGPGRWYRLR